MRYKRMETKQTRKLKVESQTGKGEVILLQQMGTNTETVGLHTAGLHAQSILKEMSPSNPPPPEDSGNPAEHVAERV